MARHQNSLGPGQYELAPSLNANGSYFLSKYMGSGCSKLGRSQRKPINEPNIAPGPGRCNHAKYPRSKFLKNKHKQYRYIFLFKISNSVIFKIWSLKQTIDSRHKASSRTWCLVYYFLYF